VKTTPTEHLESSEPSRPPAEPKHRRPLFQFLGEVPGLLLMAFLLAVLIKTFLFQAFFIPSGSMEPTLMPGDRVLVNKIPYYFGEPQRGDIVVFSNPNPQAVPDRGVIGGFFHWLFEGLGVQKPDYDDFIKRVVGLPGDTVTFKAGDVYVNGTKLDEPYLGDIKTTAPQSKYVVPAGKLFVMGDNRGNSLDSRFSLGFVPIDNVVGKAFVIIWPPSRAGVLH
jgi:signal peptidase I